MGSKADNRQIVQFQRSYGFRLRPERVGGLALRSTRSTSGSQPIVGGTQLPVSSLAPQPAGEV